MHPLLARADRALREHAGLSPEALLRRPDGKWSAAEILEHLGLTYSGTTRGLQRLIDHGVPELPPPTLEQRLGTLVVVTLGYFPAGRVSPDAMRPKGTADPATVLASTRASLAAMDTALDAAELRFGPRLRLLQHPVLGPFSLHQWRRFHWVHTRHHARQIRARAG